MEQSKENPTSDFLNAFYGSPSVEYSGVTEKLALRFLPGRNKTKKTSAGSEEEKQTESLPAERIELSDLALHEKQDLSKRTKVSLFLMLVAIPLTVIIGMYFYRNTGYSMDQSLISRIFGSRIYYFLSIVIMIYAMIPFFMVFEGRKPQARELVILAAMIALNVAGRAAFFMLPEFKPIYAVTIITGIAFGAESGFLVGSLSMLVSNFLFGQGPWTPWQMFAMGIIGFLSGILYQKKALTMKKLPLCIFGFLMGFIVYGGMMNLSNMFISAAEPNWSTLLAYYISGIPVDLVKGTATFIFLWVGARPLLEKLTRIKIKYGLIRS